MIKRGAVDFIYSTTIFITWWLVFFGLLAYISGCASDKELQMAYDARTNVVHEQAVRSQPKSLVVDCSQGCGKTIVTFIHHEDMQQVAVPQVIGTNATLIGTMPHVMNAVGWIVGAVAATKIISDISEVGGSGNTITHNTSTVNGDDNSDIGKAEMTASDSRSDSAVTSSVGDTSTTDLVNTNTSTTDVVNTNTSTFTTSNTNDSINSSYNPVDSNDAVSVPTVVSQPAPVIVQPSYPPVSNP